MKHPSPPYALAWGTDSFLVGSCDKKVVVYDREGHVLQTFDYSRDASQKTLHVAAASPSGHTVVLGSHDRSVGGVTHSITGRRAQTRPLSVQAAGVQLGPQQRPVGRGQAQRDPRPPQRHQPGVEEGRLAPVRCKSCCCSADRRGFKPSSVCCPDREPCVGGRRCLTATCAESTTRRSLRSPTSA